MTRSQRARQALGETVREIGTLTLVFAPLQAVFERGVVPFEWIAAVIVISGLVIACGVALGMDPAAARPPFP